MKYIIILSYYLMSQTGNGIEVYQKVYPQDYADTQTCEFMKQIIEVEAKRAYGENKFVVQCLGVDENQ